MQAVFELCVNLFEIFAMVGFLTLYLEPKYTGIKAFACFFACWMLSFTEICIVNSITAFESVGSYIPIILYFVYALLCLQGDILLKLWMSVITQIVVTMVAVVSNIAICTLIHYSPLEMITVFNSTRVVSVIISKVVLVIAYIVIYKNRYRSLSKTKLWYALIVIPLISVVSITEFMKIALVHTDVMNYVLLGMLCIVAANSLTYYFDAVISREYANKMRIHLLEQQAENNRQSLENSAVFVNQMRMVKHDLKNQLLILQSYVDRGNLEEASAYIKQLSESYLPSMQHMVQTGYAVFDAVVNAKRALCDSKGISFHVWVQEGSLEYLKIDDFDMGAMLGNLLDNAIEAAEKSEAKQIHFEVRKTGEYISFTFRNSIDQSVMQNNHALKTTKANSELHGVGLKSVRSIVKKYDGMLQFYEENNEFCCNILLAPCK